MKKWMIVSLVGMLLVGCTQGTSANTPTEQPSTPAPEKTEEPSTPSSQEVVGGWEATDVCVTKLSEEEQAIFDKALEGLVGVGYTPVQVLATQLVSGTNYAYLAVGETVTATPEKNYYVITVYADLNGGAELTNIHKIDSSDLHTKEDREYETSVGGWEVVPVSEPGALPDAELQGKFEEATAQLMGVTLQPVAVLGTQLVNGTNYSILCSGNAVVPNPVSKLYVLTMNVALDGKVEVLSNELVDLEYYLTEE